MVTLTGNTIIYFLGLFMILGSLFKMTPSRDFHLKQNLRFVLLLFLGIFLTVAGGFLYAPIFIGIGGLIFSILIWLFLWGIKSIKGGNLKRFIGNLTLIFFTYVVCLVIYEASIDKGARWQLVQIFDNSYYNGLPYFRPTVKPYEIAILGIMDWIAMSLYVVYPIYLKIKKHLTTENRDI